ncbi:MAG TPA: hypothetical protein VMH92_11710 [Acidocella sp.]|nr:hypothetical protein [Acidocella sp.]
MATAQNSAAGRIRERLFVMWEEAGADPDSAYQLWHKVRPLVMDRRASELMKSQKAEAALPPGASTAAD